MKPEIRRMAEKKFIGKKLQMSFASNRTSELWKSFMPHRNEIVHRNGSELFSIEIYPPDFFDNFDPANEFEKWAAIEVSSFSYIPSGMESIVSPEGLYAVFIHRGPASAGPKTFNYIFREWLPSSEYLIDNRPHFAVMGEKYKFDDPLSEEEIWIPILPQVSG